MRATVVVLALLGAVGRPAAVEFAVNAAAVGQRVWPLNGVNAGPGHMNDPALAGVVLTDQYRDMGVPLVRTHDYYGPCDLSAVFPWGWGPHAVLPAGTYRFDDTDRVIQEIRDTGCEVMFRLGESWDKDSEGYEIPGSFTQVTAVCMETVRRYAGGGVPYNDRVTLWEIWNEPNHEQFWDLQADPDCERFFDLYAEVSRALEQGFSKIIIGGPGAKGGSTAEIADFAARFAQACRDRDAPLYFYSWHSYNREHAGPYIFAKQAQEVREALVSVDPRLANIHNVLSEWSSTHFKGQAEAPTAEDERRNATLGNAEGAAFTAAALVYMNLYSDLLYACRYRGDAWAPHEGYGLVQADGSSLKKTGYALKAYSQLFPDLERGRMYALATTGGDTGDEGAADWCRALLATTDQERKTVNVLLALWRSAGRGFRLTVQGIPQEWKKPWIVHYRVSEAGDWQVVTGQGFTRPLTGTYVYEGRVRRGAWRGGMPARSTSCGCSTPPR